MHVVQVAEFGPAENLVLVEEPDRQPGSGELLLAVGAAGVNRSDLLFRSGRYHSSPPLPAVPGTEGAGTVLGVGSNVDGLAVGDRVLAWGAIDAPGFYREQAVVTAANVLPIPDSVSLAAAASLPVAWVSAWHTLRGDARLRSGETVLINAAASGVGSAAVQIAKAAGATVIGVVGAEDKQDWVRTLGADQVLNRHTADVVAEVLRLTDGRGANVALDLVGGEGFAASLKAVGHGGRVIAMANVALAPSTIDTRDFYPKNVSIFGFQLTNLIAGGWDNRPELRELLAALDEGRFTVPIDSTFPLAQAPRAHRHLESATTRGKVVLTNEN